MGVALKFGALALKALKCTHVQDSCKTVKVLKLLLSLNQACAAGAQKFRPFYASSFIRAAPGDAHSGGGIEVFAGCDRGGLDSLQMDHGGKGRESDDGSDRIVGGGTHVTPVMTGICE